jgi:hypothetical protein
LEEKYLGPEDSSSTSLRFESMSSAALRSGITGRNDGIHPLPAPTIEAAENALKVQADIREAVRLLEAGKINVSDFRLRACSFLSLPSGSFLPPTAERLLKDFSRRNNIDFKMLAHCLTSAASSINPPLAVIEANKEINPNANTRSFSLASGVGEPVHRETREEAFARVRAAADASAKSAHAPGTVPREAMIMRDDASGYLQPIRPANYRATADRVCFVDSYFITCIYSLYMHILSFFFTGNFCKRSYSFRSLCKYSY